MQFIPSWYAFGLSQDLPLTWLPVGWSETRKLVWFRQEAAATNCCENFFLSEFFWLTSWHNLNKRLNGFIVLFCLHACHWRFCHRENFHTVFTPVTCAVCKVCTLLKKACWLFPKDKSIYVVKSNLVKLDSLCNMHTIQATVNRHQPRPNSTFIMISFFGVGWNNTHT